MSTIEKYIDVNVLAETAYDQWKEFEKRPEFLELLKQVHQPDESPRHWKPEIADQDTGWDSEITCQTPYHHTGWVSQAGAFTEGVVSFHAVSDVRSRVLIQVPFVPEGAAESRGDGLGAMSVRVQKDLKQFREFVEGRGRETVAGRGKI